MIRAVLADSGPLYAVADEGDQHHQQALRQWQELDRLGVSVLVPYPVPLEAHRLVLYRLGTKAALEWLVEALDAPLMRAVFIPCDERNELRQAYRTWPVPTISYFEEVSSASAKGPRQCNFCVLMPISAPKPNSPPSVKRVDAFQ